MAGIFGLLSLDDNERVFVNTVGQDVIYDAASQLVDDHNAELEQAIAAFVEGKTENFKERFMLPGGGRLQMRGRQAQAGAVKAQGSWDVAYPLRDYGAQVSGSDVDVAYMSVQDFDRHLDTVFEMNTNTVRFEILRRLFNNTQTAFTDELHGSLNVEPLANGDTVVYPPVIGSETEATDDHYLESGYAATAISDANNPYITIKDELEEHWGQTQSGSNIVVFINAAEVPETEDLTDYDQVVDRFINPGDNVNEPFGLPVQLPGRVLGRTNSCWVVQWDWVPANYMLGIHLDAPAPLRMRIDPADTGLGDGLQLIARDEIYPIESSHYRNRFGIGCGNRLNGVVMELGTGGTYTIPTAYA
jgi:hypothetical protein